MNWFIYSLLSIGALATAELLQQHLLHTKRTFDERTSACITFLIQAIFTLPIILFTDLRNSLLDVFSPTILPYLLLVALVASFAMIYYLRSFRVKNISISSIFVSLSVVTSTTLGIIFFNESFYFYKILGIALILLAIISLNINNLQLERNHLYGLIAGLMFGVTYTLDKLLVQSIHPIIYIFWNFTLVSLFGFLLSPKTVIGTLKQAKLRDFIPLVLSGIGYFLYNLLTFTAYTVKGEVGRVDAINNSQIFIIILVEYFVFKHTDGVARKLITALIAVVGILILGFF